MTITVRSARKEDMQDVVDMIQELADFEKMPNEPKMKAKDLIRDGGFDGTLAPLFVCFIAEKTESGNEHSSNTPTVSTIGYALCYNTYSTWKGKSLFMEDLYVRPNHRGTGAGKLMINTVKKYARDTNCDHVDFQVLDWNPAKKFYEKFNAVNLTREKQWQLHRLNREHIHGNANKN